MCVSITAAGARAAVILLGVVIEFLGGSHNVLWWSRLLQIMGDTLDRRMTLEDVIGLMRMDN